MSSVPPAPATPAPAKTSTVKAIEAALSPVVTKTIAALGGVGAILTLLSDPVASYLSAFVQSHPKLAPAAGFLVAVFAALGKSAMTAKPATPAS